MSKLFEYRVESALANSYPNTASSDAAINRLSGRCPLKKDGIVRADDFEAAFLLVKSHFEEAYECSLSKIELTEVENDRYLFSED